MGVLRRTQRPLTLLHSLGELTKQAVMLTGGDQLDPPGVGPFVGGGPGQATDRRTGQVQHHAANCVRQWGTSAIVHFDALTHKGRLLQGFVASAAKDFRQRDQDHKTSPAYSCPRIRFLVSNTNRAC